MHFMTATPLAAKAGGNRTLRDETLPYGSLVGTFALLAGGRIMCQSEVMMAQAVCLLCKAVV
jgi:hypothetical protein